MLLKLSEQLWAEEDKNYYSAYNFTTRVSFGILALMHDSFQGSVVRILWAFHESCTASESQTSARAMVGDGKTKVLITPPKGKFQHQKSYFWSAHESDHDGIVRVFVGHC